MHHGALKIISVNSCELRMSGSGTLYGFVGRGCNNADRSTVLLLDHFEGCTISLLGGQAGLEPRDPFRVHALSLS